MPSLPRRRTRQRCHLWRFHTKSEYGWGLPPIAETRQRSAKEAATAATAVGAVHTRAQAYPSTAVTGAKKYSKKEGFELSHAGERDTTKRKHGAREASTLNESHIRQDSIHGSSGDKWIAGGGPRAQMPPSNELPARNSFPTLLVPTGAPIFSPHGNLVFASLGRDQMPIFRKLPEQHGVVL